MAQILHCTFSVSSLLSTGSNGSAFVNEMLIMTTAKNILSAISTEVVVCVVLNTLSFLMLTYIPVN